MKIFKQLYKQLEAGISKNAYSNSTPLSPKLVSKEKLGLLIKKKCNKNPISLKINLKIKKQGNQAGVLPIWKLSKCKPKKEFVV